MKSALIAICILLSLTGLGQSERPLSEQSFKERLYVNGNIALNFSNTGFILGGTPQVGYRITEKWSAGLGFTALWYQFRFGGLDINTSIYGGNVFTRYSIVENIFAQSEFHLLNTDRYDALGNALGRGSVPLWYVGGGVRQPLGPRSSIIAMIMYDIIDDPSSPFQNPFFGGGVSFGF